jgi:hypothetical protein
MFRHDCPLEAKPVSTPWHLLPKQIWSNSLPVDILLSAMSVLVVSLPSSRGPYELLCLSLRYHSKADKRRLLGRYSSLAD